MDKKTLSPTVIAVALLAAGTPLRAYENSCTHPVMANQALFLLQQQTTQYYELQANISNIRFGETDEDNPTLAVLNHFYDPETQMPLTTPSIPLFNQDAVTRAQGYFDTAVIKYNNGLKSVAYAQLGRVLHLAQDMAQPGHVQNDPHVPYLGVYSNAFPTGLDGSGASPLEITVEQLCQQNIASFPSGDSILMAPAGLHSGGSTLTASDYLEITARTTYLASSFPGMLNLETINLYPVGVVTIGSGTVSVGSISYAANFVDVDTGLGNQCIQVPHWEIIGSDGVTLCYDPSQTYSGSVFSGFTSNWWQIPNSPSDPWNPGAPLFYFHTYNDVSMGSGGQSVTLTTQFTNTLVPNAINSTAGLLRFFGKTVDPVKPTIELHNNDTNGAMIQPGGASGGTIFLRARDPGGSDPGGDPNFPTPSGIYAIELKNLDTGALVPITPAIATAGENPVERTFSNLDAGHYKITALDGLGNDTEVSFMIDRTPPAVGVKETDGTFLGQAGGSPVNIPSGAAFVITATGAVSGISSVAIYGHSGALISSITFNGQTPVDFGPFSGLANDSYSAVVNTLAGNSTTLNFSIYLSAPMYEVSPTNATPAILVLPGYAEMSAGSYVNGAPSPVTSSQYCSNGNCQVNCSSTICSPGATGPWVSWFNGSAHGAATGLTFTADGKVQSGTGYGPEDASDALTNTGVQLYVQASSETSFNVSITAAFTTSAHGGTYSVSYNDKCLALPWSVKSPATSLSQTVTCHLNPDPSTAKVTPQGVFYLLDSGNFASDADVRYPGRYVNTPLDASYQAQITWSIQAVAPQGAEVTVANSDNSAFVTSPSRNRLRIAVLCGVVLRENDFIRRHACALPRPFIV